MPSAEIIAIGTELLLGEIQDTNTQFIARALREEGINIFRTMIVGDNGERIIVAIQEAMERSDIIITTGGLGPTIDDPTRAAIAQVSKSELIFHPELWESISSRFIKTGRSPGENQKRQAYIPKNAQIIENPIGTAPAFWVNTGTNIIVSLPGVPSEMKYLLVNSVIPLLQEHYNIQEPLMVRILRTSGAGEGWVDEKIGDLEVFSNPTVGLAAHSGIVDIRITAKARNLAEANQLILPLEAEIHKRLGDFIFGSNEDTLEKITVEAVSSQGWTIYSIEEGTSGLLHQRLSDLNSKFYKGGKLVKQNRNSLLDTTKEINTRNYADVILGLSVRMENNLNSINLVIITPIKNLDQQVVYNGSPQTAPELAVNLILDRVRRMV